MTVNSCKQTLTIKSGMLKLTECHTLAVKAIKGLIN